MVSALSPFWRVTASSPPLAGAIWRNSATVRIKGVFTLPVTCRLWLMLSRDGAGGPACALTGSRQAIRANNRIVFNMVRPFFCCTAHIRSSQYTQVNNDLQAAFFDLLFSHCRFRCANECSIKRLTCCVRLGKLVCKGNIHECQH